MAYGVRSTLALGLERLGLPRSPAMCDVGLSWKAGRMTSGTRNSAIEDDRRLHAVLLGSFLVVQVAWFAGLAYIAVRIL